MNIKSHNTNTRSYGMKESVRLGLSEQFRKKRNVNMNAFVRQEADKLLKKYNQNKPPIDVRYIAECLELYVKPDPQLFPLPGKMERMPGDFEYMISVNPFDRETRQRFTIAHEIAHYILHEEDIGDGLIENALYRSKLGSRQESEANSFAAHLLMPLDLVHEKAMKLIEKGKKNGNDIASILSKKFNVSLIAMKIRLGLKY